MHVSRAVVAVAAALCLSGAAAAKEASYAALQRAPQRLAMGDAQKAATLISQYRAARGLAPVRVDPQLNDPAQHQARAVAQSGWLSHGDFAGRMAAFGVRGKAAENLSGGLDAVEQVIAQWQASPGHNANLLDPDFHRIGLAKASSGRTYWALVLAR